MYDSSAPCIRERSATSAQPFVREATCCILESAGFEVLPAEDAQDAMKVYEECKRGIDLVMTDMVRPGRSGERLGARSAGAITRGRGAGDVRLQQPGVRDGKLGSRTYFLAKPYSRRTLVEKIETILGAVSLGRGASQAG
jgi:FixJ family two-component response regulator